MNPIDSLKKWLLTTLIPLIERKSSHIPSKESLFENVSPKPIHSSITEQDKNEPYSDLLEDSEYN